MTFVSTVRPFLAIFFAMTLTVYLAGCTAPTEEAAHEHAEGEAHDHDHGEEGHDHEHAEGEAHDHDHGDEGHDHDHDHAGHSHAAPHGGTLIALGDHFAHLELVLNAETGELTVYVLDGEAENPVRVEHPELSLLVGDEPEEGEPDARIKVMLAAAANELTGETVGDTSEFKATSPELVGADHFHAVLETITIKGQTMEKVFIHFPEGNE